MPHRERINGYVKSSKPLSLMGNIVDEARKCIEKVHGKRTKNRCGALHMFVWNTTGNYPGLKKWSLDKFGTEKQAEDALSEMLENYYQPGFQLTHDNHLDRFLTDYDIKTFLESHFGAHSWNDVPKKVKKACYKNYPRQTLPNWDDIHQEAI